MGYSKARSAVERVQAYLEQLLMAKEDVHWATPDTFRFVNLLNDGIHAAQFHAEFKKYADLKTRFIFRQRGGVVIAELRVPLAVAIKRDLAVLTLEVPTEPIEVIGAAIEHRGNKMHFPNVDSPDESLYSWCSVNGYNIVVGDGIVLTKEEVGDIAWHP